MKQTTPQRTQVAKTTPIRAQTPTTAQNVQGRVLMRLNRLPPAQKAAVARAVIHKATADMREKEKKNLKKVVVPQSSKDYGTTKNGVSHQMSKFTLSAMQAALLAWAHTVMNPRTLYPHPVPLGAVAGGASAAEARMYQVTLYGTAVVNAQGCFFITVNSDGWTSAVPSDVTIPDTPMIALNGQYLTYPGTNINGASTSTPVTFTDEAWAGTGGSTGANFPDWAANNAPVTLDGSTITNPPAGLNGCSIPPNFCPAPYDSGNGNLDARYNEVSCELSLRPEGKLIDQAGDIGIFNWRATPTRSAYPTVAFEGLCTYDDMLTFPDTYLSRKRMAVAEWPSNKWLTAVANPNTVCCFQQPQIQQATYRGVNEPGFNNRVGFPTIFAAGKGLTPGTAIEFEVVKNYAIYGIPTFQTGTRGATDVAVGGDKVASTVMNGMRDMVGPRIDSRARESPAGVASVIKSEQMSGSMPSGSGALNAIVGGVKTAVPIIESITGTSIGETIAEVLGGLGALLL